MHVRGDDAVSMLVMGSVLYYLVYPRIILKSYMCKCGPFTKLSSTTLFAHLLANIDLLFRYMRLRDDQMEPNSKKIFVKRPICPYRPFLVGVKVLGFNEYVIRYRINIAANLTNLHEM